MALGSAGVPSLVDRVGSSDLFGRTLKVTEIAIADELASAGSLLMGQAGEGVPAVLIRGFQLDAPERPASALIRDRERRFVSMSGTASDAFGQGRVVALCGGVGGAKLALGLQRVLGSDLTLIVNTGDDFEHHGLMISPDIDTVLYTLSGLSDKERGWGRADESWNFMTSLGALGGEDWFQLGDKDLALHVLRTERLRAGAVAHLLRSRYSGSARNTRDHPTDVGRSNPHDRRNGGRSSALSALFC